MWSLTSQRDRRTSGPENFQSSAKKDFFNTIGAKRNVLLSLGTRGRQSALGITMPGAATLNAAPDQGSLSLFGRNRVHGPALALAREHEALVALLCDLGALSAVSADALRAEVGQESTRLTFYVGAHVPGIGAGH